MCGIAGIINYQGYDLEALKQALWHRGPDDQSIYCQDNVALVHTRLAIQDITLGKQPFHHQDHSIIFNGEIYNHLQLRKELLEFEFKSQSDTETLLCLYLKYGWKMFDLIDGMFAFCIVDYKKRQLFLARDRAGKKPLYYMQSGNHFFFASELNALKRITKLKINEQAIIAYLRTGFFYQAYTPYIDLHALEAGTSLSVNIDNLNISKARFFDIGEYYQNSYTQKFSDATDQVDNLLQASIRDRLLSSDIEVGVFLSGGIDSNLIAATASRIRPNIRTFTVKMAGAYDESHLARIAAEAYGTQHTELEISFDLKNDIEKILLRYGCPFMDSSAIPSFYVAKEARKYVGVVLNGDGADELFGGYRRYVSVANRLIAFFKKMGWLRKYLPFPRQKQSIYNYFYRLVSMANKKGIDFYLTATSDVYEDIYCFEQCKPLQEMAARIETVFTNKNLSPLKKMLYLDFQLLLFSDLLVKMDIATMAHSLEGRSPFLAKSLLQLAPMLPDRFKINNATTKALLRELAKKYLPPALVHQPKRGFEVPLVSWVGNDLREHIHSALGTNSYAENYVRKDFLQRLLNNKIPVAADKRAKMLWSLFCLEVWHRNETN